MAFKMNPSSVAKKVRKSKEGLALKRWFKEEWKTPDGKEDYSEGGNTFRPTKRISKDTPSTWGELTPEEKARAQKEKNTKGRVSRYKRKQDRKEKRKEKRAARKAKRKNKS